MKIKHKLINYFNLIIIFCLTIISFTFSTDNKKTNILSPKHENVENKQELNNSMKNTSGELEVLFFPLGDDSNKSFGEGDSCIITYGDIQILIDAGSKAASAQVITNRIDDLHMKDKVWDYVIVSHADSDHIAAFSTVDNVASSDYGVFQYFINKGIKIGTLIDFDFSNDDTVKMKAKDKFFNLLDPSTPQVLKRYINKRNSMIANGNIEKYFTASQCCWKKREELGFIEQSDLNNPKYLEAKEKGATNEFKLAPDLTLKILYNYYYDHRLATEDNPDGTNSIQGVDKNILSTCVLIEHKTQKFLFTGDIEEYDSASQDATEETGYKRVYAETKLIEYNKEDLKDITVFKAAHHGKKTSNCEDFINYIKPQFVAVPCVANTSEHATSEWENRTPSQIVVNNLNKYTDKIYPVSRAVLDNEDKTTSRVDYYGKVRFTSNGESTIVETTSEHLDSTPDGTFATPKSFFDTTWFEENRTSRVDVYNFDGFVNSQKAYFGQCTLVKYGSYDMVIDCGTVLSSYNEESAITTDIYVQKLKEYIVDSVIDCLILTTPDYSSIQQVVNHNDKDKKLLSSFNVKNILDFGDVPDPSKGATISKFSTYKSIVAQLSAKTFSNNGKKETTKRYDLTNYVTNEKELKLDLPKGMNIDVLNNVFYETDDDNSLVFTIGFEGYNMLFTGRNGKYCEQELIKNNTFHNIVYYQAADFGCNNSNSEDFLKAISKDVKPYIVANTVAGKKFFEKTIMDSRTMRLLNKYSHYSYLTVDNNGKNYIDVAGDFNFFIKDKKPITNKAKAYNPEFNDQYAIANFNTTKKLTETYWYKNNA